MTAFVNHFAFEFKTGLRNPMQLFINYLFPLGFYALMGVVMTQINPLFTATMIPAMVIFTVMASTILGLPSPLVESREAGIYRSFKINGVPATSIISIPVLTTIFHAVIAAAIVALTATPLFKGAAPANWLNFILITLLTAFTCGAFGALIGVVSSDNRATVFLSQLIFLPSMLLGGLMMPLNLLPASVRPFSALLPTARAMQAFLGLAYGQGIVLDPAMTRALGYRDVGAALTYNHQVVLDPTISVMILAVSGLLAFGLAIYLFNWDSRNSARRGHPLMGLLVLAPYVIGIFLG